MELLMKYALPIITTMTIYFGHVVKEKVNYHDFLYIPEVVEEMVEPIVYEMEATFYTAFCKGCTGFTKYKSVDVRNTIYIDGMRVVAVDPKLIKLGSILEVTLQNGDNFKAIAADIGKDIKDARIDVLVRTKEEAFKLGIQQAKIKILEVKK